MKIEILGTGCTKCKALEEAVKKAVAQIGGFHEVKKVEDIVEIMNYGVTTPSRPTLSIAVATNSPISSSPLADNVATCLICSRSYLSNSLICFYAKWCCYS